MPFFKLWLHDIYYFIHADMQNKEYFIMYNNSIIIVSVVQVNG